MGQNWEQQRPKSYRLNLSGGEETLWNGLKPDCRRNIRKAQQSDIDVAPFRDARLFFRMVNDTYRRHGTTSFQQEGFFMGMMNDLIERDLLWSWSASFEGKVVAACLFLHDDQEVHFVSGGSLPENGNLPTSYILHWTAIQAAVRAGLKVYNSDASQIRSIDQFKESFRPDLKDRFTLIWSPSPVRLAQKAYITGHSYVRKLRRFV
jgi:lipid II:glycine glycyltransferase (peptidoglycan interpeptide bridge formation enzyme)